MKMDSAAFSSKSDNRFRHTFLIAEMACSHEGKPELAKKIIDCAGKSGADAIQFQIWNLRAKLVPQHRDFPKESRIELSQDQWAELAAYVRQNYPRMQIIACVYERISADFAVRINVDAFKLHSSDLSNPYLVKHVAATGKRIDLSVGGSTMDEIVTAINWIQSTSKSDIWLMYGIQNFPTPVNENHLRYMAKLRNLFELSLGYQDHSDPESEASFWLPAAAVGLGVDILEKHITHDRSFKGIDHEAALNPWEFEKFAQMVRTLDGALGISTPKPLTPEEIKYRKYAKKSIVAGRDLPAGTVITEQDILFMRADVLGFPPDQSDRVLGKTLKNPVAQYRVIQEENLA